LTRPWRSSTCSCGVNIKGSETAGRQVSGYPEKKEKFALHAMK
jgi:hypothetical protein